ncbi:MAG: 50S ribosomal protein L25 [Acidimicrobiia bacterium]
MADVTLTAESRTELGSGPAGRYRRAGKVPAVVYGLDADTLSITVGARELERILHGAGGANTLITLALADGDALALARQIQRHPTRGELTHVDFIRVRRDVAVSAEVPLHIEGEAPGARQGGMVEQLLFNVTVEAMPGNIPEELVIDISTLELGDQLRVADLPVPAGVSLQHEGDELVVQVAIPRGMEEGGEGEEGAEGEEGEGGETSASAEGGESAGGDSGGEG